jgi:hypothetical protein
MPRSIRVNVKVIKHGWNCSETKKLVGKCGTLACKQVWGFVDVDIEGTIHTVHKKELKVLSRTVKTL